MTLALAQQVHAEATAAVRRRRIAGSTGTVDTVLELVRPAAAGQPSCGLSDRRPFALDRSPCAHCGARGDLGCVHQQPCLPPLPIEARESAETPGLSDPDRSCSRCGGPVSPASQGRCRRCNGHRKSIDGGDAA